MSLKIILKFPALLRRVFYAGSYRTFSYCALECHWFQGSVVPGSTTPRPGDRLKDGHSTMGSPQVLEPEKTQGSKENCTIYEPCNLGNRNLSEPQVLHL